MTRFLITTAAAFAISGTAFAQDAMQDATVEEGVELIQEGTEMTQQGAEIVEEATDAKMGMKDKMMGKDMMTTTVEPAPVVLSSEPAPMAGEVEQVAVPCPAGSTAQPDGSCMLEGDALPE